MMILTSMLVKKLSPKNNLNHTFSLINVVADFNFNLNYCNQILSRQVFSSIIMSSVCLPKVVFVLGPPGSGKGTQCEKICKEFGYVHLSAGELLREEMNSKDSEYSQLISAHIENGTIVPVEITCALLEKAMTKNCQQSSDGSKGCDGNFLIDGFPRNSGNLDGWKKTMTGKVEEKFMIFFDCPREISIDRCLRRGQAGSGRTDDNEKSMQKRLNTYYNDTLPIIEHYAGLGMVRKIDARPGPDEVFEKVKELFRQSNESVSSGDKQASS
ncbi:cytidine/uridine monophosphate kinase Dak1 [Brevipalpus obovatus]|uniref:cytidine/uridine monophosphate kinase Dak1 n=1 Tax=Brevipalpus obovatus TaxID=246614 RepID=UPI003D9E257A